MQMTAREAMHLTELRSQPAGPPRLPARRAGDAPGDRRGAPGDRRRVHAHLLRGRRPGAPRGRAPHRAQAPGRSTGLSGRGQRRQAGGRHPNRRHRDRSTPQASRTPTNGPPIAARHRSSTSARSRSSSSRPARCWRSRTARLRPTPRSATIVPDLPRWATEVRVRHLVHHTSGLTDRDLNEFPGVPITGVPGWGNEDLLAEIRGLDALAFRPGSRYTYSNRGYHLLGQTVAAAAGRSLAAFAEQRHLRTAGHDRHLLPGRALDAAAERGARALRGGGRPHLRRAGGVPRGRGGGLWTTIDDLARWDAASYDTAAVASRLATRGALDDGTPIHYGWGLSVRTHRGLPIHSHGGSFPGWAAKMVRFPEQRTTVAILANHEREDVSSEAFQMADRLLAGALDPGGSPRRRHLRRPRLSAGRSTGRPQGCFGTLTPFHGSRFPLPVLAGGLCRRRVHRGYLRVDAVVAEPRTAHRASRRSRGVVMLALLDLRERGGRLEPTKLEIDPATAETVREILQRVFVEGDEVLIELAAKFDGVDLSGRGMLVTEEEFARGRARHATRAAARARRADRASAHYSPSARSRPSGGTSATACASARSCGRCDRSAATCRAAGRATPRPSR